MHIDPWIFSFSALTVIATIWMGFWAAKKSKTASDFFVAGRSVSVGWNASAISGEYLSAASFMGVAGMVMSSGYDALWYPVCYACGYLFLLLFIAGPLRRFGAYTIPDFAEGRYDSPVFRKIAVVFVLFIGFFYTMPQMKGAGTTLAYIFPGLPYWAGVVLVGAVITLNVALGGMKGITLVQAFQYWAKMFAISVPIFVLMSVYGHYGKQVELQNAPLPVATNALLNLPTQPNYVLKNPGPYATIVNSLGEDDLLAKYSIKPIKEFFPMATDALGQPVKTVGLKRVWLAGKLLISGKRLTATASNPGPMESILRGYADYASRAVLTTSEGLTNQVGVFAFAALTHDGLAKQIESFVTKHGFDFIHGTDERVYVVPQAISSTFQAELLNRSSIRKTLPNKAPKDETWLNPFGPLTTKAAKIAERIPTDFELLAADENLSEQIRPMNQTIYAKDLFTQIERIKRVLQKPVAIPNWRTVIRAGTSNVNSDIPGLLSVYHAAANRVILWQTNLEPSSRFPVDASHTELTTDAEFAAKMESALRSNGVSLVSAPHNAIVALRTSDLERLRSETQAKREHNSGGRIKAYALLYTYSLIMALVCGTAGLPHILVRFYTNPDGAAAKRTTMWVMILIGVFYLFPPVFGVMGRNLLPDLYAASGAKGTDKIVLELPRILNEPMGKSENEKVGEANTGSISPAHFPTRSLSAGPANKRANTIPWGSILSGITCAGAFAAFMSTFSGLLVSMTGALAHDVYGRIFRPRSTPQQRLVAFKISTVVIGAMAILLGTRVEQLQINFMVGQAFAIAAASYFPLLFMSCWWRGMTMKGAATGMLTGGSCALIAVTLTNFSDLKWIDLANFWAAHPLARILCEQPAIWTVPLAIGLMVIVSKLTRHQVPADIRMKMLVLHAPEQLGLKQEYIQEHQPH